MGLVGEEEGGDGGGAAGEEEGDEVDVVDAQSVQDAAAHVRVPLPVEGPVRPLQSLGPLQALKWA